MIESFGWAHERLRSYIEALTEELVEASVKFIEFDSGRAHEMGRPMWEMLLSVGSHGSGTEARSLLYRSRCQPRRNRLLRVRLAASPTLTKSSWRKLRSAVPSDILTPAPSLPLALGLRDTS